MDQHRRIMFRLGGIFLFCVIYPFFFTLLPLSIKTLPIYPLVEFLLSIGLYGWPLLTLTSALFWLYCGISKINPSDVWKPVLITVAVMTVFMIIGLAFYDAPPMDELDIPDWAFKVALVLGAGILFWLPFTKPFAILQHPNPYQINFILFLIPPAIFIISFALVIASLP